jgi:hypothetical protein
MARFEDRTGSRTWNEVKSQQARTAGGKPKIDPILALFVCVLRDGRLEIGCGT